MRLSVYTVQLLSDIGHRSACLALHMACNATYGRPSKAVFMAVDGEVFWHIP